MAKFSITFIRGINLMCASIYMRFGKDYDEY